jgi:hypothetical protein
MHVRASIILCGLLAAGVAPGQTSERGLRWELKQGDTLRYGMTWSFRQKEDVGQMNFRDVKINVAYTLEQTVKSVSDGTASVEAKVAVLKATVDPTMMGMPMGKMEFDSEKEDEERNMLKVLREAVGKSFTFQLSPTGQVSDVTGGQGIRDAVAAAAEEQAKKAPQGGGMGGGGMGGMMGPGMVSMLAARLTVAFEDETLQTTLDLVNNVLPPEPKTKGQTWTRDVVEKLPQLGSVTFKGKYTHGGERGGGTRITFAPEGKVEMVKAEPGEGGSEFQQEDSESLSAMKVQRTQVDGTSTFGAGRLKKSEVTQTIEAEGDLPPMLANQARPGDKLQASFTLVLSYELLEGDKKQF